MGKGSSGAGGGVRDNTAWGGGGGAVERTEDGYTMYRDDEAIEEHLRNEAWEGRLDEGQKEAIEAYANAHDVYKQINETLRMGKPADELTQQRIENLSSALDDSWLGENIVVTRRLGPEMFGGAQYPSEFREMYGQTVTDEGFASSSAKVDFRAYANTRPIEAHIKVKGRQKGVGAYINAFSEHTGPEYGESEFLFNKKSTFRILGSYYDAKGKTHVNLEYVGRGT